MSFAKAKRFMYKTPEEKLPSPADYLITSKLEKGCRISNTPRFSSPKKKEDTTATCTRLSHSHAHNLRCSTPKTDQDHNGRDDLDVNSIISAFKSKIIEFNRNDIKRKSIREKSSKGKGKAQAGQYTSKHCKQYTTREPDDYIEADKLPAFGSEEFIDDDYHSFTSSEELDQLKKTEEYEFNEICKALKRMQSHKSPKVNNFQDTVLYKLENIEKSMEHVKGNLENLHTDKVDTHHDKEIAKLSDVKIHQSVEKHQEMTDIITKAIEFLGKQCQKQRQNIFKDTKDKIYRAVAEIFKTSEQSGEQIEEICKQTASQLADNVNVYLKDTGKPALEFTAINETEFAVEEKCQIDNKNAVEILPHSSSKKMNCDLEEFVYEFEEFQNELDIEGNLIQALQKEISEMKRILYKEN